MKVESAQLSNTVASAVVQAVSHAVDPVFVIQGPAEEPRLVWSNNAFVEAMRGELVDLESEPIESILEMDSFSINDVRRTTFGVILKVRDGSRSVWSGSALPVRSEEECCWVVKLTKEDGLAQLDDQLKASEERFRALSERAPIGIFSSEMGLRFGYVNDAFSDLIGAPATGLLGTQWMEYIEPEDLELVTNGLQSTLAGESFESPARLRSASGQEMWVNLRVVPVVGLDSPAAFLGTVEDVTDRRQLEEYLSWQAVHDPLTRLPSRAKLVDEIQEALDADDNQLALLFFDLDDFKSVNDSHGHSAGDDLLISVANRLRHAVRSEDRVYRFAGDEFVVLAHNVSSDVEALGFANRILRSVAQPATIRGHSIAISCSVGVVRAMESRSAEDLIHDADTAMYQAKNAGKGSATLIQTETLMQRDESIRLRNRIIDAIGQNRITLEYQPFVCPTTQKAIAAEAQLHWHDEIQGPVGSDAIIEAAIRGGLIREVTEIVIDQACADLGAWRQSGPSPAWVSVNLTPDQLLAPGIVDYLARALLRSRLSGDDLAVELTESSWATSDERLEAAVNELVSLGPLLVLDRVGEAVSSLDSLAEASLSAIKLDASFAFGRKDREQTVVKSIVGLAHDLGMDVIASGVDSPSDLDEAVSFGLELIQGSHLGHPVIAAAIPSLFGGDT